jgi:hypothetical protein
MCFDYGLVLPLGLCFRKTGGFTKQIPSPARRNGKTAPIEIQQQMQDNIQWIKKIN